MGSSEHARAAIGNGLSERAERAVLRTLLALPQPLRRRLAGPPLRRDGLELDLDTQLLLKLAQRDPEPPLRTLTPTQARAQLRRSAGRVMGAPLAMAEVRAITIAGRLAARLYVPVQDASGTGALVVYFHGGGWVVGDLDTHDSVCRALARSSGARVLSVEYRLAPEHPFPAGVDDALASFRDAVGPRERAGRRSGADRGCGRQRRRAPGRRDGAARRRGRAPARVPAADLPGHRLPAPRSLADGVRHGLLAHEGEHGLVRGELHRRRRPRRPPHLAASRRQLRRAGAGDGRDRRLRPAA